MMLCMQLFITQRQQHKDIDMVSITDQRVVHKVFRVLRMQQWDRCRIQCDHAPENWSLETHRCEIEIVSCDKKEIIGCVIEESHREISRVWRVAVAYPHTSSKAELLVQKLTELGIGEIVFWRAERSQRGEYTQNKKRRLTDIALAASEQSQRWSVPVLSSMTWDDIIKQDQIVVVDFDGHKASEISFCPETMMVIGPEWWFSAQEKDLLTHIAHAQVLSLGETVLRMETATIIAWYVLVSHVW